MRKPIAVLLMMCFAAGSLFTQNLPELKLNNDKNIFNSSLGSFTKSAEITQPKKRKTVNAYFGAGYSLVIFTDGNMTDAYPLFDTRSGNFLSDINLFFGFSIAKAVTLELEPSIMFANSNKNFVTHLSVEHTQGLNDTLVYTSNPGMFSIPIVANVRFFPFYKMEKSFARLFFIGGGAGAVWVKEDYDNLYTSQPQQYVPSYGYSYGGPTESTSQWAPVFRIMTGFTGAGGVFGFGGEVRYNIVPLKQIANSPFKSRIAKNFNSVDLSIRFYFSL